MFYPGTKKRISISNGAKKEVSEIKKSNVKNPSKDYLTIRSGLIKTCKEGMKKKITADEKRRIVWLRTRIDLEL